MFNDDPDGVMFMVSVLLCCIICLLVSYRVVMPRT